MLKKEDIDNNLFNEKRMEEFIELYNDSLVIKSDNNPINTWIKKLENNELMDEKSNYITFFEIILNDLLGYTSKDIEFENNIGKEGHPVEFTLKKDDTDFVVVELKGTTYKDLTKRKNGRISPVEQASNYASAKKETKWAIVSNYDEFRLFSPTSRENYISFKFHELKNPKILKKFLLIFSKFSLITKNIPEILLKETKLIERDLEDEFYQLFSETRLMLIKELESNSELNRLESIRISQLILNRYIFLCFAEDLNLIPPETTADVLLTPIKHNNLSRYTMWNRLNELFIFSDEGNNEKGITNFNGGLFHEDLYGLKIRDKIDDYTFFDECYKKWGFTEKYKIIEKELGNYKNNLNPIYKNLLVISSFDFGTELSVNILGHIFENSIGDIEELKDETTKKRRKKDGVYYTPEYITDYICRNTIIPYLSISNEINDVHELIKEYGNINNLDLLDKRLKEIKIIDIACGSGAFLNKAVDVLFEIHEVLHESKYSGDESLNRYFDSLDSRRQIISNNIYGVDLNDESVEITKLSLFLKLATSSGVRQGFKLPNLDKNIKCGNSLVDDETIAGNKAFDWEKEFEDILNGNKFDIIIGNPPYVDIKEMDSKISEYIFEKYETSFNRINLYSTFIEKSYSLLKNDGIFSYIIPNSILFNSTYSKTRKLILNNTSILNIVRTSDDVFKDAKVEPIILIFKKGYAKENKTKILIKKEDMEEIPINNYSKHFFTQERWVENNSIINIFSDDTTFDLLKKIDRDNEKLIDYCDFSLGLTPYDKYKGMSEDIIKNRKFHSNTKIDDTYKELLDGSDITRYNVKWGGKEYIKYGDWLGAPREEKFFKNPRILIRQILSVAPNEHKKRIFAGYTEKELYNAQIGFNIILKETIDNKQLLKYLLGLINSKMMTWYYEEKYMDKNKKNFAKILIENTKNLPIIVDKNYFDEILLNVEKIMDLNNKYIEEKKSMQKWFKRTFKIDKLSKKLENYYQLDFKDFLKEMKKKKVDIKQRETQELLENEFNNSINIIKPLQKQINELDEKIDKLVYELYELTDEDIEIIEKSLKRLSNKYFF